MDDDQKALAELPALADRLNYHTKRLRIIQFVSGTEGVRAYKTKFPEAKGILTRATTIAFQPKPKGYSDFLCGLVDRWFRSDAALAETNKSDVERLNRSLHPRAFNPANHFSKPMSRSLLEKLAEVFAENGSHLDISRPLTMAKVRAAVKSAKVQRSAGKPFGSFGHIRDDHLTIGTQSFRIEQHNGHDCIRIMVNGSRVRLRLDALEQAMGSLSQAIGNPDKSLPLSSIENRKGEVAPAPEGVPDTDPLNETLQETWPPPLASPGELTPKPTEPSSLSDRIAALRAAEHSYHPACADGVDPLTL
jgi:hypothetical protein